MTDGMTGYERMKKYRQQDFDHHIVELERLVEDHKGIFLSRESYKLGLMFAIRQIEGTEMLHIKAHKELRYSNPQEAEREHRNQMNTLMMLKKSLTDRYEGKP